MINLKHLKNFFVTNLHGNVQALCAGSGLVILNEKIYLIADDQLEMGIFPLHFDQPGSLFKLLEGSLPYGESGRKKLKPDLEVLVALNKSQLLALPSGSTQNRMTGCLISLANDLPTTSIPIDCRPLYSHLLSFFPELNIEGAVVTGEVLKLFQRGNGVLGKNAVISITIKKNKFELSPDKIIKIQDYELGQLNGCALGFTDAAQHEGEIYFVAAAENSLSTYQDGLYAGAVLSLLSESGEIISTWPLDCPHKPEGLWVLGSHFYLVTDSDSLTQPSGLYLGQLPLK